MSRIFVWAWMVLRTQLKASCYTYAACMFVYVLVSSPLLFSFSVVRIWALSSECNIDLVEFTGQIPILPSDLMKEIDVNPEAFHQGLHKQCIVSLTFLGTNLLALSVIFLSQLRSSSQQCLTISFFLMLKPLTELMCLFGPSFTECLKLPRCNALQLGIFARFRFKAYR